MFSHSEVKIPLVLLGIPIKVGNHVRQGKDLMQKIKYILISIGSTSLRASADVRWKRLDNTMLNLKSSVREQMCQRMWGSIGSTTSVNYLLCTSGQVHLWSHGSLLLRSSHFASQSMSMISEIISIVLKNQGRIL